MGKLERQMPDGNDGDLDHARHDEQHARERNDGTQIEEWSEDGERRAERRHADRDSARDFHGMKTFLMRGATDAGRSRRVQGSMLAAEAR
jgi:hypothetical protein